MPSLLAVTLCLMVSLTTTYASGISERQVLGPATGDAKAHFMITSIVAPLYVKQNGPKATRLIYWAGTPTFPVTVPSVASVLKA